MPSFWNQRPTSHVRLFLGVGPSDLAWALLTPVLAFLIRDGEIKQTDVVAAYCFTALIASVIAFRWFNISAQLAVFFSINDALAVIKACVTTVALTAVVIFSFTRLANAPRSVPVIHLMLLASGLIGTRIAARLVWARQSAQVAAPRFEELENILIVGATRLAWFFIRILDEFPSHERVVAVVDERPWLHHRSLNGCPIAGSPLRLAKVIDEYATHGVEIGKVVVATPPHDLVGAVWVEVQAACKARNVSIELLPERFSLSPPPQLADPPGAQLEPAAADTIWSYWGIKRGVDFILALLAAITIAPLAILVALLVLIDVGYPIVFWQQRIGRLGRPLCIYKFRTMRSAFDRDGRPVPESQRVSSLGRLLRQNRLDEIPQLLNILTGSMSFVGPRPLLPVDQPENFRIRLQVRPGLTGLAQINGGKLLSPEEKMALDEWYVRYASLWLELRILARTVWVMLRGDRRNEAEISFALAERDMKLDAAACPLQP